MPSLLPTAGQVTIFDREVRSLGRDDIARTRRRIGIVHQDCSSSITCRSPPMWHCR